MTRTIIQSAKKISLIVIASLVVCLFVTGCHKHTFAKAYSFDETYHWHVATCGHDVVNDKSEHAFVDKECTICGYTDQSDNWEITNDGIITPKDKNRIKGSVIIPSMVNNIIVTGISDNAFTKCPRLKSVFIPDTVTSVGKGAFVGCSSLTSFFIGTENGFFSSDGGMLFNKDKTSLIAYPSASGSITIPESVITIEGSAFSDCTEITSVIITDSVTSIGNAAFNNCSRLESVSIGNSVTDIGLLAFCDCTGLTSLTIGYSVKNIEMFAFRGCFRLTSVIIPDSVISIGAGAFWDCTGLTRITIGNSVLSIGTSAFSGCKGLTEVNIGNSVSSIGQMAFSSCSGLTKVTIPNSVKTIKEYAFWDCPRLKTVNYSGTKSQWKSITKSSWINYTTTDSVYCLDGIVSLTIYDSI